MKDLVNSGTDPKIIIEKMKELHNKYKHLNIFISEFFDEAIETANYTKCIPMAIKDCFHMKGKVSTAGSRMLKNMEAPFDATLVKRLENDCTFVGKASMDEFAMGSCGIYNYYGYTISPWKNKHGVHMCPGGSSSGSAAAVALGCALAALGTDTAGSTRLPAAFCGVVGLKPTYGVFSRYGMIELSSSLDCPGLITKNVEDCEYLFQKIIGIDENEYNTCDYEPLKSFKRVAIFRDKSANEEILEKIDQVEKLLQSNGYETFSCHIELLEYTVPIYQLICSTEASSNLSRFNGLIYGDKDLPYEDPFVDVRTKCFGEEVKRRIIAGNYFTYFGNRDGLYEKTKQILTAIHHNVCQILEFADCILMPTSGSAGMTMEQSTNPDPVAMYLCDYYTAFANLLGIPAISIPVGLFKSTHTPMGLQLVSKHFGENLLFEVGEIMDKHFNFVQNNNWRNNE